MSSTTEEDKTGSSASTSNTVLTTSLEYEENEEEGDTFNQYHVVDHLGRGSYSTVYKVENTETGEHFALKLCSKKQLKRKRVGRFGNALQDVEREVELLKQLDHPNVANLVEVINDESHDKFCLVFQLASGGTLMDEGEEAPLEIGHARDVFRGIVEALEYVHGQLIIHRDVKPENVLLHESGEVVLTDFGVSHKLKSEDELIRKTAGSPAYLSPEVVSGDTFLGPPVDVWALGITLYVMLTGKVPFQTTHIMDLYAMIKEEEVTYPDDMDPSAKELLQRMLEKDASKRITLAEIRESKFFLGEE